MKKAVVLLLIIAFAMRVKAQVAVRNQPDSSYYTMVVKTCKPFTPTEQEIVNVKPNKLPVNIQDTLKKYDW